MADGSRRFLPILSERHRIYPEALFGATVFIPNLLLSIEGKGKKRPPFPSYLNRRDWDEAKTDLAK
jgi:hypothetical protein